MSQLERTRVALDSERMSESRRSSTVWAADAQASARPSQIWSVVYAQLNCQFRSVSMWHHWLIIGAFYLFASLLCQGQVKRGGSTPPDISGVRLRIEAPLDRSVYRIGETIPLELLFSSSGPPQFRLRLSPSSRQLDGTLDLVSVEPVSGWQDPMEDFFRFCPVMFMGGLTNSRVLSGNPIKVRLILNESVRLMETGQYYVKVISRRVNAIKAFPNMPQPIVESNSLLLQIIAAPRDWQSQTLEDAMRVINSSNGDSMEQREQRRNAVNALRFLGTEDAAHAMARLISSEPYSLELLTGLVASPARETVADEMRRLLVDPHFPVVREFLCGLVIVENPLVPGNAQASRQSAFEARLREELRAVLPQKLGKAREISSVTVDSMP